ncbi:hypothetical protein [Brevibacterium luteolum]|uniref:hypothetical protein n=1 Tax=Brevibacterium luteolum TaxID=199591 RepID=UPI001BB1AA3F|nr:hypothetical protein [Brevibacterium luteolum]
MAHRSPRPALRSLRLRHLPALLVLGIVTGFMTTFFLAAMARIPLGTAVAIEFLGSLTVAGLTGLLKVWLTSRLDKFQEGERSCPRSTPMSSSNQRSSS